MRFTHEQHSIYTSSDRSHQRVFIKPDHKLIPKYRQTTTPMYESSAVRWPFGTSGSTGSPARPSSHASKRMPCYARVTFSKIFDRSFFPSELGPRETCSLRLVFLGHESTPWSGAIRGYPKMLKGCSLPTTYKRITCGKKTELFIRKAGQGGCEK